MPIVHGGNIFEIAAKSGWNWRDIADFSASINPLGPAPGVTDAICCAIERIVHYPDRNNTRLRQILAATWHIDEDQILLGNGAAELIFFVARLFTTRQTTLAVPMFQEFHRAFAHAHTVSLDDPANWPAEGLLCVTRPANPTGYSVSLSDLEARLSTSSAPLLVDESFIEFSSLTPVTTLTKRYPHLIVLRSLTKFHALPGVRVGVLVSSADAVRKWQTQREPWQVGVLAEEAAIAALSDTEHAATSKEFMRVEKAWLLDELRLLPEIQTSESDANYLHIALKYPAARLVEHMLQRKILIRDCSKWPGLTGESVRIAVRRRDENERLLQAWKEFPCV